MLTKLSEGTPQQQAAMRTFRAYNERIYTEKQPTCYSFAVEVELLESLIRAHWGRADAKTFMAFIMDLAWDYISPYDYLKEWTHKAVEHIKQGMPFAELEPAGFFKTEGSLFPLWNSEALMRRHELLAYDEQSQLGSTVKFSDQIAQAMNESKTYTRNNN